MYIQFIYIKFTLNTVKRILASWKGYYFITSI